MTSNVKSGEQIFKSSSVFFTFVHQQSRSQ